MGKLLIVANRLPVSVERRKGANAYHRSVGGLATGLSSIKGFDERVWVGWPGISSRLDSSERETMRSELRDRYQYEPVFLTLDDVADFYHGFCNRTIWPLFHYFSRYAEFDPCFWQAYERANRKYRDAVLELYEPGDRIWIHDYQLMLLPKLLRDKLPNASIGFFLHIPFPSWELFRLLPWRREIIEGILGAGLIGFHTNDYAQHFLRSVRTTVGIEDRNGRMRVGGRLALADAFPMGIDYGRYAGGASLGPAKRERSRIESHSKKTRLVLSVDRLDYTKGIPERLRAFDGLFERYPEWRGKVTLICVAVPSRDRVDQYRLLKQEVDGLIGDINGRRGTIDWTPIRYMYRSLPFSTLLGMYAAADVALVTPLRDGMNLIAKEYVAARSANGSGVLVLSEMAGAAHEMTEALLVNPHDKTRMIDVLNEALIMPEAEQRRRGDDMRRRLERYDVTRWAQDFMSRLEDVAMMQVGLDEHYLTPDARDRLLRAFHAAERRLFILDYDGTLVSFNPNPAAVGPDKALLSLLSDLASDERNTVVAISGRDPQTLEEWLGETGISLVAEHGMWLKEPDHEWATLVPVSNEWKSRIRPILEIWVDRTPRSFVEEKEYSLAWHYRSADAALARRRLAELTETVGSLAADLGLSLLDGNKVLEIKSESVDKGRAAFRWMGSGNYQFIFAVGDDTTDEDVFEAAPPEAWTIKVGGGPSRATFAISRPTAMRALLRSMLDDDPEASQEAMPVGALLVERP